MRYGFLSRLSTAAEVAESLARYVALTGDVTCVNQMFATLDEVTPEDVRKAANTWLLPEQHGRDPAHEGPRCRPSTADSATLREARRSDAVGRPTPVTREPALAPVLRRPCSAGSEACSSVKRIRRLVPIWFQVGSQDDPPGKEGLAALTGR